MNSPTTEIKLMCKYKITSSNPGALHALKVIFAVIPNAINNDESGLEKRMWDSQQAPQPGLVCLG